jgi:ATP-dependent Clp protease adaptor protein ClpS
MTVDHRQDDLGQCGTPRVGLRATAAPLFERHPGARQQLAVADRVQPKRNSTLDVALSICRLIRANFASRVGILMGSGGRREPLVDCRSVGKSNEPMPPIDVTLYVPARLADDDRKRKGDGSPGTAVITKTRPQTKRPNLYRVLLLNDDYTPMEFVVHVLERFFNKDHETAHRIMMHVHQHGIGECGVYTYEVAETKVTQVMDFARKHQHPLQCIMEKK